MKFMNLKRFASMAMAGVMTLSLAVPALAEDQSTTITGTYTETELQVTVPTTGTAIINPYGLPTPTMEDGETVISGEPITTGAPLIISNQSKVDLAVSVKGTITEKGGVKIVTTENAVEVAQTPNPALQPKNIWVNFEMFAAPELDVENETDPSVTNPAYAKLKSADADVTLTFDKDNTVDGSDTLVLRAGQDETTQKGGAAYIRLSGKVAKKPSKTGTGSALEDDPWVAADGFEAKIVYTFEPDEYVTDTFDLTIPAITAASFAATSITSDPLPEGTVVTNPAEQITVTTSNQDAAGKDPKVAAVAAGSWNASTRVFTGSITDLNGAVATNKIDVTVKVVADNGLVYKGTKTVTLG